MYYKYIPFTINNTYYTLQCTYQTEQCAIYISVLRFVRCARNSVFMNYIGIISNKIHAITIGTYDLVIQLGYETKINPFSSFYQILSCVDVLCYISRLFHSRRPSRSNYTGISIGTTEENLTLNTHFKRMMLTTS